MSLMASWRDLRGVGNGPAQRSLYTYLLGRLTSELGDRFIPIALAFAALHLDASPSTLGMVLAGAALPPLLVLPIGGALADRFGSRRMMLLADAARCVIQISTAVVLLTGHASVVGLVALQVATGTAAALFNPAVVGLVPRVANGRSLQAVNALLGLGRSIARLLGPALAGVLVAATSPGTAFAFDAATYAVSTVCLATITLAPAAVGARESLWRQVSAGWAEFRSRRWLVTMVCYFGVFQGTVLSSVYVLGPTVAERYLGGAPAWAAALTAWGLGTVLGGVAAIRVKPTRPLVFGVALTVLEVPQLLALAHGGPLSLLLAASMVSGLVLPVVWVQFETAMQTQVPAELLGRVSSYDWLISGALFPLGLLVVGPLAYRFGLSTVLVCVAAIHVLAGVTAIFVGRLGTIGRFAPHTGVRAGLVGPTPKD